MRLRGPWNADQVAAFLGEAAIPMRLALLGSSGSPIVLSLWYVHEGGRLWCATQEQAKIVGHLRREPRCGFEVACENPPYRGVRGQGTARVAPAEGLPVLRRLIERYLGRDDSAFARGLLARADSEVAIEITPERVLSWDFTERMTSA